MSPELKNALALFAGFVSWDDFVAQTPIPEKGSFLEDETVSVSNLETQEKAEFRNKLRFVMILALLALLLWAGFQLQAGNLTSF